MYRFLNTSENQFSPTGRKGNQNTDETKKLSSFLKNKHDDDQRVYKQYKSSLGQNMVSERSYTFCCLQESSLIRFFIGDKNYLNDRTLMGGGRFFLKTIIKAKKKKNNLTTLVLNV